MSVQLGVFLSQTLFSIRLYFLGEILENQCFYTITKLMVTRFLRPPRLATGKVVTGLEKAGIESFSFVPKSGSGGEIPEESVCFLCPRFTDKPIGVSGGMHGCCVA